MAGRQCSAPAARGRCAATWRRRSSAACCASWKGSTASASGTTYYGERSIVTDEQVARLQVGNSLDDDSQNPVVWSRTRTPTFAW